MTGCSASGNSGLEIKPAESFSTLAELQSAAQLQVMATVTDVTRIESVGSGDPVEFTVTSVIVLKSNQVALASAGQTLQIRQTGTVARRLAEDPLLPAGQTVVLFLDKFHFTADDQTNQWVIKGLWMGQFVKSASGEYRQSSGPAGERKSTFVTTLPSSAITGLK